MKYHNENYFQKRNYSNSPFYKNIHQSNNNIMDIKQSNSSQNIDLDSNIFPQDEYSHNDNDNIGNKEFQQLINEKNMIIQNLQNKIDELNFKARDDKYKTIKTKNENDILKRNLIVLKEELKRLNKIYLNNQKRKKINQNYLDLNQNQIDLNDNLNINSYYINTFNNKKGERNSSVKLKKRNINLINNINENEIINYYKEKIDELLIQIYELNNELAQKKIIIIKLTTKNNDLLAQFKNLKKKYILLSDNYNLMAISSLKNKNNININNYKIRNNSNNNMNYNNINNIVDRKNQTYINFYKPRIKKNGSVSNYIEDNLSNEFGYSYNNKFMGSLLKNSPFNKKNLQNEKEENNK